jgi:hypothetical protein
MSYTTAFAVAAGVFFAGSLIAVTLYTGRSAAAVQQGPSAHVGVDAGPLERSPGHASGADGNPQLVE